ncbi:MAG: type II toxin-antitoxin system HicA family toxin [Pirellulaceae bacterium]
MPMKVREAIRLVEQDGWILIRTKGSHRQFPSSDQTWNCHHRG